MEFFNMSAVVKRLWIIVGIANQSSRKFATCLKILMAKWATCSKILTATKKITMSIPMNKRKLRMRAQALKRCNLRALANVCFSSKPAHIASECPLQLAIDHFV